ncbi:hypothetical protein GU3_03095 [Oceanimonas sp. GK1]|uniref:DUF6482 family protein n=1 Tax=Oceanimonas sp. (strain GK1 / IBRC-M 10197) TaxID=511062 RepID=UPI0002494C20|nr:DUF6482 family protein [Oceanimonas sp. GK1]AEY00376.1 hypothetical protein GU3_03095 [Oceanimonas sp. GK1]
MWEIRTLLQQHTPIDTLFIHAHDMSLYTIEAAIGDERRPLADGDKVLAFRSIEHARERLAALKVARCLLVHHSPYQEMVGLAAQTAPPMELELSWPGWQAESQH